MKTKTARLEELNALLNMDQKEAAIIDEEPDEDAGERRLPPARLSIQMER